MEMGNWCHRKGRIAGANFLSMREGHSTQWRDWPFLREQVFHANEQEGRQQDICADISSGQ